MTSDDKSKQEEMRKYYDSSSYYVDAKSNFAHTKNRFNQYVVNNVLNIYYPAQGEKILDFGCGWGNISLTLQKKGFEVIGLDYSRVAIEICKESARSLDLDETRFICLDVTETQFEDNSIDVIYCADLVEHLYPGIYLGLIKEAHRILKENGKLIIYTPNPSHILEFLKRYNIVLKKDVSHVDFKTMKVMKKTLSENGFEIVRACFIESHLPVLNKIEKTLMNLIPIFRRRNAILAVKMIDDK